MTTPRARYDPVITLGNLLTILTLVGAAMAFAMKTNERIAVLEQVVHDHERRIETFETGHDAASK